MLYWQSQVKNLHASWKPTNPPEIVWKEPYRMMMNDHIAGKGSYSLNHDKFVLTFILMPKVRKIREAETAVDKEWEKLDKNTKGRVVLRSL